MSERDWEWDWKVVLNSSSVGDEMRRQEALEAHRRRREADDEIFRQQAEAAVLAKAEADRAAMEELADEEERLELRKQLLASQEET